MGTLVPFFAASKFTHPKSKYRISACLIVKDEATHLANCLESLQGVVDEIIIVDTGSTDDTVAIAKQYTDKISHYDWHDDFAAARNYGLQYATGDWILNIDADETLPASTAKLIPRYLQQHANQPVVLNWRVVSEHQPDLYSRGLFPNHHGIYFAGRVHEIPVLPHPSLRDKLNCHTEPLDRLGTSFVEALTDCTSSHELNQKLSSYHCYDLVIEHHNTAPHPVKSAYYHRLLEQMVNETSDLRLHNHALKHLGLSYLTQGQWQSAKETLSACADQFETLKITPEDGFYQEVVKGLKQAKTPLQPLKSSRSIWSKRIAAFSLSLLAACQSVAPNTMPSQQKSILLSEVPDLRGSQKNRSTSGDFTIKNNVHCPDDQDLVSACVYQSGGAVIWGDYIDYAATQSDGIYCFGDRNDPDTMCTNRYMCQDAIGCQPRSTPTPEPPCGGGVQESPTDGTPTTDNGCDGGDEGNGSGGGSSCPEGTEAWNGQCVDVCRVDQTRDLETGICELPEADTCEESPLLLPEALTGLVKSASALLAPNHSGFGTLAITPQQTGLPEGFKHFEPTLRQVQALQLKIDTEQSKASPNQTKITLWNQQIQLKQQDVDDIQLSLVQWISGLETQRADFRNQLNSLKQDSSHSQDVYQGHSDPERPQTLAEYKEKISETQYLFSDFIQNENTYDLLDASDVVASEQELYIHLLHDYLAQKFPFGPEEPDEDPTDETLEKQNTPKKLINYLAHRIVNHSERLRLQQQKTNQIVTEGLQRLGMPAEAYSKSYHDQLEQQFLDSIEQSENILSELKEQLQTESGFSIQATNQQKNALEKQIEKVQAAINIAKNTILNAAGQAPDVIAKTAKSAFDNLAKEAAKLREMAQDYGPEAIEKMNQFYATIDPAFNWNTGWIFSTWVRNCVFNACSNTYQSYYPPPQTLPAFPEAKKAPRKTPVKGGGGLRARWKDKKFIYEWDSQHGAVEKYSKNGRNHLGEFDHNTGAQTKPADPKRSVEP